MNWKYNPLIGLVALFIIVAVVGFHYFKTKIAGQKKAYSVILICENHDSPLIFQAEVGAKERTMKPDAAYTHLVRESFEAVRTSAD